MDELITTQPTELVTLAAQPLDRNPAAVYLAGLDSKRSQRTQAQALGVIADLLGAPDVMSCNWAALRFQHTAAIRAQLSGRYAPATTNRLICALRGVLKAAWRLGDMSAEDMMRACDIKSVKSKKLPAGRALPKGEISALVDACERDITAAGARDAAIIAAMYPAGCRREEVVDLDLEDYDQVTGNLRIRHGKGNKERITTVEAGGHRAMADWLAIRGSEPGPLFWPINKGGRLQPRRMTNQAVYNVLVKRAAQAKVKNVSPHDLRRSFITDYITATGNMSAAKTLAGHESIETTDLYYRLDLQVALDGMSKLHFPYRGRMV